MAISNLFNPLQQSLSQGLQLSLMIMLQVLIVLFRPDIVDRENRVKPVQPSQIQKTYDYVIIGAGSAGSVIANRLSENGNWTVLLLEAGEDEPLLSDVPGVYTSLQKTEIDWQFLTESSENYCLSASNHQCDYPRGKALGGTSVINSMAYVRGNHKDYDRWAAAGNPGWDYRSVLPYFKKSEDMRIPELKDSPYHQTGGYLTVEQFRYRSVLISYVVKANEETGVNQIDINGANQTGIMYVPSTTRDGLRCSTAKAFLRSASKRSNLDISTNSMVDKILIDENTKTAYGVKFHIGIVEYEVEARREVILSAGFIQSPQLLMLSGVGPKQHLEEIGINVILDAPGVGQNLHDHVWSTGLSYLVDPPPNYINELSPQGGPVQTLAINSNETLTPTSIQQFIENKGGPLYGIPLGEAISFNSTKFRNPSEDDPDILFSWVSMTQASNDGRLRVGYTGYAFNLKPRSKGYIKLRSKDSSVQPIIVTNYFDDPHDLDTLVEGMKMIHSLKDTKIMRELNAQPVPITPALPCVKYEYESDDYWKCYTRYYSLAGLHGSGTCRMGPANDLTAVVDSRLRVYGIKNLRVIDASIMPNVTTGNTNAPTIMIAEKGADLIKEDAAQK